MNYPPIIKGTTESYCFGDNPSNIEVPIQDIERFVLVHKPDRNGLQVYAYIKPELIDRVIQHNHFFEPSTEERIIAKYRENQSRFTIRSKDMPKFRKEIYALLSKQPTIVTRHGINAGTPVAMSWEIRKKEIVLVGCVA